MRTQRIVRAVYTTRGSELDMRVSDKVGPELAQEIVDSVKRTQLFISQPLPNWLILSYKQFVSLLSDMQEISDTGDRLYVTPLNAMEVQVDRDIDPVVIEADSDQD